MPCSLRWRVESGSLPFLLLFATWVLDNDIGLRGKRGHSLGGLVAHGLGRWQRLFDFLLLGVALAQVPLLGRQAGLTGRFGLCSGKVFLRRCRFLRLRSSSCAPLGRFIECLVEFGLASVGLGAGWWELTLTARDLPGGWRVWCIQTASRLVHASSRLLIFIALSQSRLLLQGRASLLLASSGTLLCRSSDRGPIARACSVNL